jgi:hypothetical protein
MKDPGMSNPPKVKNMGHSTSGTHGSDPHKQHKSGEAKNVEPKG